MSRTLRCGSAYFATSLLSIFFVSEWLLMFVSISFILLLNVHIIILQRVIQDILLPTLFYEIHENWSIENQQVLIAYLK